MSRLNGGGHGTPAPLIMGNRKRAIPVPVLPNSLHRLGSCRTIAELLAVAKTRTYNGPRILPSPLLGTQAMPRRIAWCLIALATFIGCSRPSSPSSQPDEESGPAWFEEITPRLNIN